MAPSDERSPGRSGASGSTATPVPTGGQTGSPAETTIAGDVEAGVESGCLILRFGGETYNLVGGDRSVIRPGAHVTVRGRPNPDVVTTCMQGIPFEVVEAYAA